MANAAFAHDAGNLANDARLTASGQEIEAPASFLQNPHLRRQWVGLSNSDYVIADLLSVQNFDTLALLGLDAESCRIRLSATDSSAAAAEVWDSGDLAVNATFRRVVQLRPALASARYARFDVTAAAGQVPKAGRLVIAPRTAMTRNYAKGEERAYIDPSIVQPTVGMATQVYERAGTRGISVTFSALAEGDVTGVVDAIDRLCGIRKDVLFITNPDSADLARDSYWGLVKTLTGVVRAQPNLWTKQLQIEERG